LKRIKSGAKWRDANKSVFPDGSFGNGGAMRAPVIGLHCAPDLAECARIAREVASITHAHPLGMEGAALISTATAAALSNASALEIFDLAAKHCAEAEFVKKLDIARPWLAAREDRPPKEVVRHLGNGVAAADSCVTALYLALRFLREPFDELMDFVIRCGGDVDTIGAMSGAIFGAGNGMSGLPEEHLLYLEARERIQATGEALHRTTLRNERG
jgi:poly(ADP-ribose) glycohydrolase ARH3